MFSTTLTQFIEISIITKINILRCIKLAGVTVNFTHHPMNHYNYKILLNLYFQAQSPKFYGKASIYIFLIFSHILNKCHHCGVTHRNHKQVFTNGKLYTTLYLSFTGFLRQIRNSIKFYNTHHSLTLISYNSLLSAIIFYKFYKPFSILSTNNGWGISFINF